MKSRKKLENKINDRQSAAYILRTLAEAKTNRQ